MWASGGCLCGGVRYEIDAAPTWQGHCHCSMCRRSAGAPVVTWVSVPAASFRVVKGRLRTWQSSGKAERQFCPDCGAQVTFQYLAKRDSIDVTAATLDDAGKVAPQEQVWWDDRVPYLHVEDDLPRRPPPANWTV